MHTASEYINITDDKTKENFYHTITKNFNIGELVEINALGEKKNAFIDSYQKGKYGELSQLFFSFGTLFGGGTIATIVNAQTIGENTIILSTIEHGNMTIKRLNN